MYFESSKKNNYYRFPSVNSIHEMDSRYYFPEKSHSSGDTFRQEAKSDHFTGDKEMFMLIK